MNVLLKDTTVVLMLTVLTHQVVITVTVIQDLVVMDTIVQVCVSISIGCCADPGPVVQYYNIIYIHKVK